MIRELEGDLQRLNATKGRPEEIETKQQKKRTLDNKRIDLLNELADLERALSDGSGAAKSVVAPQVPRALPEPEKAEE